MTATADHFVRGVRRHQAGALADAEGAYRAVLDADPRHHEALRLLGLLCARDGRPNEAMALVQRAIEATDQPGLAWHARGQLDIDAGRLDDAATAFAQATVTLPTFVRAWVDLALVRERQGRLDEAADAWAEAARREPNEPDHHLMRGTVLAHLGRHVDAIESLERATALAPESAIAWSALGAVLRRVDRWDDALSALRRANALDPERAETAVTLIDALLDRREIRVATAEARRALEHWPHDASVHHVAARTLECAAELEMAESHLRIAIDLDPRAVDARVSLADLLARTDRIDEADRAYRDAIRRQPDHADA
ncbi:MAG: tetratricopeptide repeat protein, partial [Phycisphaerales bacterium]|nr:tetratricopeptide repeat protein [Phycisphaerales bacterium]